jgi:hypothetical protein
LRRDECGDWAIFGNNGHVYAVPEGYQLMIGCDLEPRWSSARGWESAKRRLSFAAVTPDGDDEGALILDRIPTKAEAAEIRAVLGIPKRVELSEGRLAILREHAVANAFLQRRRGSRRNGWRGGLTPPKPLYDIDYSSCRARLWQTQHQNPDPERAQVCASLTFAA